MPTRICLSSGIHFTGCQRPRGRHAARNKVKRSQWRVVFEVARALATNGVEAGGVLRKWHFGDVYRYWELARELAPDRPVSPPAAYWIMAELTVSCRTLEDRPWAAL